MDAVEYELQQRSHCVIARNGNILQVNFNKYAHPPQSKFPGASALRGNQLGISQLEHEIIRSFLATGGRKLDYFSLAQQLLI